MERANVHRYKKDPQSGAGNCVCGHPERSLKHRHIFVRAINQEPAGSNTRCTCSAKLSEPIHR